MLFQDGIRLLLRCEGEAHIFPTIESNYNNRMWNEKCESVCTAVNVRANPPVEDCVLVWPVCIVLVMGGNGN